ncbi:hypothetical protein AB0O76_28755 [Streptomyces sp. NPDC086554]|uniref:hypothetical protein n=1 Tax=Streptomyces sp. NPDC086554 TaxID=3154864 RepID=UPI003445AC71
MGDVSTPEAAEPTRPPTPCAPRCSAAAICACCCSVWWWPLPALLLAGLILAPIVLATTGSTAAISTILGGPVVASVMVVEAAGLGSTQLVILLLPCLLASATGALVFTGFGKWTGLSVGGLQLPQLPPDVNPDAGDFLWGVPAAVLIAAIGIACSGLPGLGTTPGLALGLAAAAGITGLPLTSAILAVLLLGDDAYNQMPLIVTASVAAFITAQLLRRRDSAEPD